MRVVGIANLTPEEDRRQRLRVQLVQDSRNVSVLLDLLADIVDARDWEKSGFSFAHYMETPYDAGGVGWSLGNLETILKLKHDLEREGRESEATVERMTRMRAQVKRLLNTALPAHGEIGQGRNRVDNVNSKTNGGNSHSYTIRRLMRDAPNLAEQVINGELTPNRAAQLAGFRKKTITLPIDSEAVVKAIKRHFTPDQVQEIARALEE